MWKPHLQRAETCKAGLLPLSHCPILILAVHDSAKTFSVVRWMTLGINRNRKKQKPGSVFRWMTLGINRSRNRKKQKPGKSWNHWFWSWSPLYWWTLGSWGRIQPVGNNDDHSWRSINSTTKTMIRCSLYLNRKKRMRKKPAKKGCGPFSATSLSPFAHLEF